MAEVAVIVGVGPGLGAALARRFSTAGLSVAIASRDMAKVTAIAANIGADVYAYRCDAKNEEDVETVFRKIERSLGTPGVVIHNASGYVRKSILESTREDFEQCWRVTCLGLKQLSQ